MHWVCIVLSTGGSNVFVPCCLGRAKADPVFDVFFQSMDEGRASGIGGSGKGILGDFAGCDREGMGKGGCTLFTVLGKDSVSPNRGRENDVFGDGSVSELEEDGMSDMFAILCRDGAANEEEKLCPPGANAANTLPVLDNPSDGKKAEG
jgi:hypothetical protein